MGSSSELKKEIKFLKSDLEEKSKNLILAAQCGKDLLEKNLELNLKIEDLIKQSKKDSEKYEQNTYNLNRKLDEKEKMVENLSEVMENLEKCMQKRDEELEKYKVMFSGLTKRKDKLQEQLDASLREVEIFKEKCTEYENLLEKYKQSSVEALNITDRMNCTATDEQIQSLQLEISALTSQTRELEGNAISLRADLNAQRGQNEDHRQKIHQMQQQIEEKECECTHLSNELQRKKVEMDELQVALDQMTLSQVDPNKKGNSLFSELEDNRQALESRLISVNAKNQYMKKELQHKNQQIANLKMNYILMLNMTESASDSEYQNYLRRCLDETRDRLTDALARIEELEAILAGRRDQDESQKGIVYKDYQAKVEELQKEVRKLYSLKVSLNDQILELKRKLLRAERAKDLEVVENAKLKIEIEDLKLAALDKREEEKQSQTPKTQVIIENFDQADTSMAATARVDAVTGASVVCGSANNGETPDARSRDSRRVNDEAQSVAESDGDGASVNGESCAVKPNNELPKDAPTSRAPKSVSFQIEEKTENCDDSGKNRRVMVAPKVIMSTQETEDCNVQ